MTSTKILSPHDTQWGDLLSWCAHDTYHTAHYCSVDAAERKGRPVALYAESHGMGLLIPISINNLPPNLEDGDQLADAQSPYGYACPLIFNLGEAGGLVQEHAIPVLLKNVCVAAREIGLISLFVRMHTLILSPLSVFSEFGTVVKHGPTVWVDLTTTEDQRWRSMRSSHRFEIKKLLAEGFTVEQVSLKDHIKEFRDCYESNMKRVGADTSYFFSAEYYEGLASSKGFECHYFVVRKEGKVASVGLFFECNGIIQFHLSGTSEEFLRWHPSKLLLHHVGEHFARTGARVLHLGGGLGASEDSLFKFKAGFSDNRGIFHTWRVVLDPERYSFFAAKRGQGEHKQNGFFPAYRA